MVFIAQISLTVRVGFPLQDWIWTVCQDDLDTWFFRILSSWSFSGIGGLKDSLDLDIVFLLGLDYCVLLIQRC